MRLTKKTQSKLDQMRVEMRADTTKAIEALKGEINEAVKKGHQEKATELYRELEGLREVYRCLTPSGIVETLILIGLDHMLSSDFEAKLIEVGIKPGRPYGKS